ncbi:hypothetical protein GCM10027429_11060 [Marivirga atlantica]|jgi:hypothetical protein|uniref:Protein SirB1 N-terminal domain-containing protein n=1 Tax=Marivirga atlantica TaxID=1548457 RepID=A0A937DJB3_9BACT|nr:hypothetical protein [Marivirga atlantica]MBL0764719.1 hypothetical protein [Marivirga atlantica]
MNYKNYIFFISIILFSLAGIQSELRATHTFPVDNAVQKQIPDSIKTQYFAQLEPLLNKLAKKKGNSIDYFLEHLFYKTHRKILKHYTKYNSSLDEVLANGNYDCVTGSLLYAFILDHFNIPYKIIETDFHAFLIVKPEGKEFIFEVTDPLGGFITDKKEVLKFKIKYFPDKNSLGLNSADEIGRAYFTSSEGNTIYNEVNFMQLYALQYYNQGILALNNKAYQKAVEELKIARNIYPSRRVKAIMAISESLSD